MQHTRQTLALLLALLVATAGLPFAASAATAEKNIAARGTPIVSVPADKLQGAGSRQIDVICDGYFPDDYVTDNTVQYDTFSGGVRSVEETYDYFGYTFGENYTFSKLVYQEGRHFGNGGWFADDLNVEVLQDGVWHAVSYAFEGKAYPQLGSSGTQQDYGPSFEIFTLTFDPVTGQGLRLIGLPGGDSQFTNCAELEVWALVDNYADYTALDEQLAAVPWDLSLYTAETAQAVRSVVAAVTRDKTMDEQAVVDGWTAALRDALAALVKRPTIIVEKNVAERGNILVSAQPYQLQGAGNRSSEVIRDGYFPDDSVADNTVQYDTFSGEVRTIDSAYDYFGYTFGEDYTFTKLVYQEGRHFGNGGWFADDLNVEVLQDGAWQPVPYSFDGIDYPLYGDVAVADDYGPSFEIFTFVFEPVTGRGLRLIGLPGGDSQFTNCAELEVWASVEQAEGPDDPGPAPFTNEDPWNITDAELHDKIFGGLVGKMAGVSWGAPTEFRYPGALIPEADVPAWRPGTINDAFWQDDLFVMVPFLQAMDENGVDVSVEKAAEYFRDSTFGLAHGNLAARNNLRAGIPADQAGSYLYNPHCDDIDWQIDADFTGVISPGLVNQAIQQAWRLGHIIGYGDGVYGGVFVAAMYARAYTAETVADIIEAGRQAVPEGSRFRQMIEDCLASYQAGNSFENNWRGMQKTWGEDDRCPDGCGEGNRFNIDAKMNAVHILLGLLYGEGDFEQSVRIAMRCGDDSDCNPSSVGGILGTWMGWSNIPDTFTRSLNHTTRFANTAYTVDDFAAAEEKLAVETLQKQGVAKTDAGWALDAAQTVSPAPLEQWPDMPTVSLALTAKSLMLIAKAVAWDKSGIASVTWDFGDGSETESDQVTSHLYVQEGDYTVTCTVTSVAGHTVTVTQSVVIYDNMAPFGTPIALVTSPQGGGSQSLETIRDGVMPPSGSAYDQQYDSFTGQAKEEEDYYGYTFSRDYVFTALIFQEGAHFSDGGWFVDGGPRVQVRQNGEWVDASLRRDVAYPVGTEQIDFGPDFEVYTYLLEPIQGDGIRLIGQAGGKARFTSCAELIVSAQPDPPNEEAIAAAEAAIRALPEEIDASAAEAVAAARTAVDALTAAERRLVDSGLLEKLAAAEAALAALAPAYTPGDINGDEAINAADALLALQHSVKLIELEGDKALAADVSGDGQINASDALLILQYSVKLIDVFPVETA